MVVKKLLVDDKIQACVNKYVSWLLSFSGKSFYFLEKRILSIFKLCTSSNLLLFYELLIGPQPTFSECIVIFL